jgi:melibiose permease/lactose/raffinose/galactose permease
VGASVIVQLAAILLTAFIIGFGQSLIYMVITIYLTNTIEYNEFKTGSRDEAIIFSMRPFMAKMGSALQQAIITVAYLAIGMLNITNGISEVEKKANMGDITEAVKTLQIKEILDNASSNIALWLRIIMVVAPIILIYGAYVVIRKKVTLDEDNYEDMLAAIEARKTTVTTEDL